MIKLVPKISGDGVEVIPKLVTKTKEKGSYSTRHRQIVSD
jgi:hypothetical protein